MRCPSLKIIRCEEGGGSQDALLEGYTRRFPPFERRCWLDKILSR